MNDHRNLFRPKNAMELAFERAVQDKHDKAGKAQQDKWETLVLAKATPEDHRRFLQSMANRGRDGLR